jgi:hypothetical protein
MRANDNKICPPSLGLINNSLLWMAQEDCSRCFDISAQSLAEPLSSVVDNGVGTVPYSLLHLLTKIIRQLPSLRGRHERWLSDRYDPDLGTIRPRTLSDFLHSGVAKARPIYGQEYPHICLPSTQRRQAGFCQIT